MDASLGQTFRRTARQLLPILDQQAPLRDLRAQRVFLSIDRTKQMTDVKQGTTVQTEQHVRRAQLRNRSVR